MRFRPKLVASRTWTLLCLASTALFGLPGHLDAQDLLNEFHFANSQARPSADGPSALADIAYASGIALSLLTVETVESFDQWASKQLSRDIDNKDTGIRWGGRELGNGRVTLALAAAPLAYGIAFGDADWRRLGLHSLESMYAAAFLARILKISVGRARPSHSSEADEYDHFSSEAAFHSFPSDHTTRVFAVAATFAQHLGDSAPWVPWVAYSLATWTATTRVMDRAHWLTDVTAGAFLGILTSRLVERLNHREPRDRSATLGFFSLPNGGAGFGVSVAVH